MEPVCMRPMRSGQVALMINMVASLPVRGVLVQAPRSPSGYGRW